MLYKGVLQMHNAINTAAQTELDWGLIGSTVVTGLVIVFLILAILVLFLWLFGKIFKVINDAGNKKAQLKQVTPQQAANTRTPVSPAPEPEDDYIEEDDDEIIAVIAAAIAAYGAAEGKQYRIASIKRPRSARSGWSSAGIADNMRGFYN